MASFEYTVETSETVGGRTEWWTVAYQPVGGWTHDNAIGWCRMTWPRLDGMGNEARIRRRRGPRCSWQPHRVYRVSDGIVRRTDR